MDLPPTTVLLIVLIAAVANVVVLLAVYARHRVDRARQLVDVGGFMSSSYASDGFAEDPERVPGGWLPSDEASEGWPASRYVRSDATVVPELAIGTDQGARYVLVAGTGGTVEYRPVSLGAKSGPWRVVSDAVRPGDQIVLPGLPGLRPGMKVNPVAEVVR